MSEQDTSHLSIASSIVVFVLLISCVLWFSYARYLQRQLEVLQAELRQTNRQVSWNTTANKYQNFSITENENKINDLQGRQTKLDKRITRLQR